MIISILKGSLMQSLPKSFSIMKKRSRPISSSPSTPPPSSPATLKSKPISNSFKNPQRTLLTSSPKWVPLNISKSELFLPLTFPTGQTFRWKQTGPLEFTGVVGSHLVSLKHLDNGDIAACFHNSKDDLFDAKLVLVDFLNVGICLSDLWKEFSGSDSRFAQLAPYLGGARVVRQDPLECLVQFICSSNNNIKRITQMVDFVSGLGVYLGTVEGFRFYEFPTLDRLSDVSEEELRVAGFGYRAKYITRTVDALRAKPGGGVKWLSSLRDLDLQMAIDALTTLPGVGPKVAACVALFSLDQHHAIPVDTHVWQIATTHLIPELAGTRLTPKLYGRVAEAFVCKYGKYAGWAQTLLFIAELPSQKALLPSILWTTAEKKPSKPKKAKKYVEDI
ncbi:N-glycosylase/DNA lyase OGG1-like [Apium graveolens]|uniref:DNA-(apurinic or apyrimidinic site) lyase n=1 Tax=Apium graveolens TaxID=4045 RepID=A0A6L5B8V8_APIGR|nr:hypothetical protein AG4045_002717 [Apium graveolens]